MVVLSNGMRKRWREWQEFGLEHVEFGCLLVKWDS